MEQPDYGGSKSTNPKDIDAEVKVAFETTVKKTNQELTNKSIAPVSAETAEQSTGHMNVSQSTTQVTKPQLPKTVTNFAQVQSQRKLNNQGITQTTMDFGQWNPPPVLRNYLLNIPARQEIEPVAQTFADVHKLASSHSNFGARGGGFGNGTGGGSFGGRGGLGSRGGGFSGGATQQVNVPQLDFSYIDQTSVNALGLGPIPADTLREMADAGQIWVHDPGAEYKFVVMWAPGWNADRYKRYGGAGAPSSEQMSADIIDQAMEWKLSGKDSQALIGRMMAEDHGGMLSVEQYQTLPDFDYYAQIGANIQNPTYDEAIGYGYVFGQRPGAEPVGNIVTYSRENWRKIAGDESDWYPTIGQSIYRYMTQDEVDVYNYLLAKEGETAAQEFLGALEEMLNYRYGTEVAERVCGIDDDVGRTLATGMYAVSAGADEWGSGVRQLFSEERLPTSPVQYGSAYIRNDLQQDENGLGLLAYDTVTAVSNTVPSVLTSILLGPGASAAVQGASAAGNAYNQALADGYSTEQAATYGTLIGASEGALQYVLGGISKLGGVSSKQLLTKIAGIENGLLRASAALGIKGLSEVTEEELQLVLEPLYRTIVFGEAYDAPTIEEYVYTAVVSFAVTGVMEAGEITSYARNRPVQAVEWDFVDAAVDPDENMIYDGIAKQGSEETLDKELLAELLLSGEKHTPDKIIAIAKSSENKLVWIEKGSKRAGLDHIIERHADDFVCQGVSQEEIPHYIMYALKSGKIVGYQGRGIGRPIYEFVYKGKRCKVAVTVSENGFVVGANPK